MTAATLEQRYYKGINDPGSHPGHLIPMVAGTLGGGTPGCGPRTDPDRMTFVPFVKVRRAQHDDDFETWDSGRPAPTLNAMDNNSDTHATVLIPTTFRWHASGRAGFDVRENHVGTLTVGTGLGIPSPPAVITSTAVHLTQDPITGEEVSISIGTTSGSIGVHNDNPATGTAVRRLTPLECERLMGWPDGWTAEGINGPMADSHRYRMCGNGVVAPVAEWIGRRL